MNSKEEKRRKEEFLKERTELMESSTTLMEKASYNGNKSKVRRCESRSDELRWRVSVCIA